MKIIEDSSSLAPNKEATAIVQWDMEEIFKHKESYIDVWILIGAAERQDPLLHNQIPLQALPTINLMVGQSLVNMAWKEYLVD
ncbi:hypothetical protein DSO57_1027556 [Entomophthora muscae]|uniref:Uncharacterized protein n=1 Tax=Entomophthora muscae TaxID=34485 RepID=A0ACC2SEG6_9FUNG|nr:hypothetical protein DSO57_1027556 [Entomophthora muscae]